MATVYMNLCLAKQTNAEIYSKIHFFKYERVLNKIDDYCRTLKCSMVPHKPKLKNINNYFVSCHVDFAN